jgi:hypothetical protein
MLEVLGKKGSLNSIYMYTLDMFVWHKTLQIVLGQDIWYWDFAGEFCNLYTWYIGELYKRSVIPTVVYVVVWVNRNLQFFALNVFVFGWILN